MSHWEDCTCIDCVRGRYHRGLGQALPPPPPPSLLSPATPYSPPAAPSPLSPPSPPSPPYNPSSAYPVPGSLLPPLPPAPILLPPLVVPSPVPTSSLSPPPPPPPPPPPTYPDPLADMSRGRTAYQQLTTKFQILKESIFSDPLIFNLTDVQGEESWWSTNASDLVSLANLALPLTVAQLEGMITWLSAIDPTRTYAPSEFIQLINKLILGQAVSFPSIEIPARVIKFLASALRVTITGPQETVYMNQLQGLRSQEYDAMNQLFTDEASLTLAASELSSGLTTQQNLDDASGQVATSQRALQAIRDQIASVNTLLADQRAVILSSDQLADYLRKNMPVSPEQQTLNDRYVALQLAITQSQELTYDNQTKQTQVLNARLPYLLAEENAQSNYLVSRSPSDLNLLQQAQAALQPFSDQLLALSNDLQTIIENHPDAFPGGSAVVDESVLEPFIAQSIQDAATNNPSDLMQVVETAMSLEATDTDNRMTWLQNEQAEAIQAKQTEFQNYFQIQTEAKLQFYQDQLKASQDAYNQLLTAVNALGAKVTDLQNQISANITALSGVIGWMAHINGWTDDLMNQSYMIGVMLDGVVSLKGQYDVISVSGVNQTLWSGSDDVVLYAEDGVTVTYQETVAGNSYDIAGQTQGLRIAMDQANTDYQMQSPAMIATLNQIQNGIAAIKQAYQITSDLVNSDGYMQSMVLQFAQTPEAALLQSDVDAVVTPMRELTLQASTNQEVMNGLMDDIEAYVLKQQGIDLSAMIGLPYLQKQQLWVGVCDHLTANAPRIPELQVYISQLSDRINSGNPLDGDPDCLNVAKIGLMNVIGAQMIQRQLQKDTDFQTQMQEDADADAKACVTQTGTG